MEDLLIQPFVKMGEGEKALYKFVNGQKTYTEKEWKELHRSNEVKLQNEVKSKASKSNKQDKSEEHTED